MAINPYANRPKVPGHVEKVDPLNALDDAIPAPDAEQKATEPSLNKYDETYLEMAVHWGKKNSYCKRRQVGCLVVKDNNIIADGYNGTPSGMENDCEETDANGDLVTKWYTLHAEANALAKLPKPEECAGATLYVSLEPCKECSKTIIQKKISRVIYAEGYRDSEGVDLLKKVGIEVIHMPITTSVQDSIVPETTEPQI